MEDNQQAITNQPSPGTSSASVVKASQQPPQPGVSEPQQQRQHRPDSSNLPSNDSSANLLSNNSQLLETSSLRTNNSSDCIVTYDSDSCWPLSHGSSSSKFNATQGSAARLNGLDNPLEFESRDNNSIFNELDQRSESETQFTIGPMNDQNENMICMNHEDRQQLDQFDTLQLYDQDLEEDDGTYESHKQVIVGICAMAKKAQSKPMNEILRRLEDYFEYIKTLVFEESVILNKPIEEWPLCDCLISFHSKGFPLSKAIEYARLRRPFLVNDLDIQYDIQDRRKVYKILEEADIELPRYAVLDCDSPNPEDRELIESDDHIEVANVVFNKPFVEKPISAEDHNICIYYPAHAGGGSQRLFRKIGCRSSVYSNKSHVRKTGSYIYEEFMPTDGTDVKVYTAGPDYAHAEARKSPALDGKVERDSDGKEIRYPVILTNREKLIARKVCLAFKQTVCGFDLLRANGKSYVCDVNGFSFVKSSMKYYEDCSKILGNMMLRALAPQLHIPWSIPFQLDDPPIVPTTFGRMMELRCVIAVIRHGDRTPKQKMKLEVKHPKFFELYHKYENSKNGQAKVKKPKQLQEVLDIARYLLGELPQQPPPGEVVEPRVKLKQLKSVLEMYGHFSGINRKVQLKYQPHGRPRRSSSEDECSREPSLVLILKWGGELTPAGRVQAEDLGRCFRRLYPASGDYSGPQGLGLLRLHSTFRHDLKIYASDEGRVQMTAAAFAKGFLALEGELTPILFQMVKSANTNGLLDNDCESSKCQKIVKERLHNIMQKNQDLIEEDMKILNPTDAPSIEAACKFICNPYQACEKIYKLIKELNSLIRSKRQDNCYTQEYHLYHGETWDLLQRRWAKLEKDFKFPRSKRFDISKIPDIYDCIKYDLQHNQHTLQFQFAHELHTYAKALADIVIPQEYGMTAQEKLMIGLGTCSPLLRKIQSDLIRNSDSSNEDETESVNRLDPKYSHGVSSPDRHVRTRLYFTSESHIHSLVTALQFGGLLDVKKDEQWQRSMEFLSAISELNYLSQIVIMLYEDPTKEPTSDDRFHVEIHFSSGVINRISQQNMPTEPQGPGFRPHLQTKSYSNASTGATGANETDNDMSFDSVTIRARLNVSAMQQQQQQGTGMIKEEPTDDERSTDGDSRSHSKSSSICVTPKKSNVSGAESKQSIATLVPPVTASNGHSEESDVENNDTLTQTKVNRLTNRCPQRCLARSYSAVAPLSLQDLFKKDDKLVSSELESTDEQQADELSTSVTPTDNKPSLLSTCRINELNAAVNDENQKGQQPSLHSTEQTAASTATPSTQSSSSTLRQHQPMADYSRLCTPTYEYCIPKSTSEMADNDQDVVADKVNVSENQQHQKRELQEEDSVDGNAATTTDNSARLNQTNDKPPKAQATPTTRVPDKKNWKTYEQYLASEMTNGGQLLHHHHHYRRRCQNQFDQQLVNLPPTYHTIHHWNYSPAHLNSVGKTSASMSTSPQQIGSYYNTNSLHQRYLAHKQQQQQQAAGNNKQQYFTLSASTPVHYKSMQNPRACSVADVSQYCGGPSLISTAVISGSSPELVAVCPYSPNIRPLETLHNELSLKQFIEFITRITRNHRSSNNPSSDSHHRHQAIADSRSEKADIEKGGSEGGSNEQQESNLRSDNGDGDDNENSAQRDANSSNTANNSGFYLPTCGNNRHHQNNAPLGLSPGNSLSNSLIWSGPPSSFASSPGPSSPGPSSPASAALELWAKLELSESTNPESLNGSSGTALTATTTTPPHTTTTATTTTTTTTTTSASSSSSSTLTATAALTTTAAMTTAAATTTVDE